MYSRPFTCFTQDEIDEIFPDLFLKDRETKLCLTNVVLFAID